MYIDKSITFSKTLQFSQKASELKKNGRKIISLGLGEPDFDTPDHIKDAAVEALKRGLTRYSSAPGLPELREIVADKLLTENGINANADEIIITPGAKNALFLACAALLEPGDEVINLTPCYVSNVPILKIAEPKMLIHNIPMKRNTFNIDQDLIRSKLTDKTKLILINFPNNPTGVMLTDADAEFLAELANENNVYILSDEIYEKITYGSLQHISMASFSDLQYKVITVGGFSKAYAMTGWRIGYVHAKSDITKIMLKIHQQLNTNTAVFIQKAAIAALTGSHVHLSKFIENLKHRRDIIKNLFDQNQKINGSIPDGGFFSFIDISRTGLQSDKFCTDLLDEKGVAVIPGISFGEHYDDHIRLSLVNTTAQLNEGIHLLDEFVNERVVMS